MSGAEVSGEEQDEDGGAAILPPAKRKVRGMEKKTKKNTAIITSNLCLNLFVAVAEKVDL